MDSGPGLSVERLGPFVEEPRYEPIASADVLVIGGGPAGLTAAIEARSLGADVLLLERDTLLGGAAIYAGGALLFSGTPEQEAQGISDSPAVLLADWPEMTGGDPDAPWVTRFAEDNVPEVHDWLAGLGGSVWLSQEQSNGESRPRIHVFGGEGLGLVGLLAGQLPLDSVMFAAEATALVMGEDGVEGALVTLEGDTAFIAAASVVVATGGFLRDLSLVSWADSTLDTDALWFSTGPQATGDGHRMLSALGADWLNPGAIGLYAHGVPDPHVAGEEVLLTSLADGIWVNTDGERFLMAPQTNSYATADMVLRQPGQLAYAIFDADTRPEDGHFFDPIVPPDELPSQVTVEDLLAAGTAHQADTLAALAGAAGIDPDGLAAAAAGTSGPWLAVRIAPVLAKSFGGIAVDLDGAVLADGAALPGVFAAGELTGMAGGSLVGDGGFTGSLSAVLLSGRIAGRGAAEYRR